MEFLLHVLDNVVDGKEQEESGDCDGDVGEDENTGDFDLGNLAGSKHHRIIRCGIHLQKKKQIISRHSHMISLPYLTVAFYLHIVMAHSIAAIMRPQHILVNQNHTILMLKFSNTLG